MAEVQQADVWSDAEEKFLREQYELGVSSTAISRMIMQKFGKRRTRNAVIGKIHRSEYRRGG